MSANQILKPSVASQGAMLGGTACAMLGTYYVYDSIGPVAEFLSRRLGFSDTQIGSLNAAYSLPNVALGLAGGILVDRFGARAIVVSTSLICLAGAVLTARGSHFPVMVLGRFLLGMGSETLTVAVIVALAQWFVGRSFALCFALTFSLARLGSYLADRSPSFARSLYQQGWQPPLWLAAGAAAMAFGGAILYWVIDRREGTRGSLRIYESGARIDASLWVPTVLLGLSFSLVPAVLWPSVARYVAPERRGTAYGLMTMLQNIGLALGNLLVGRLNDNSLAGTANRAGYEPMFWFFGLLSLAGFLFAALLGWRDSRAEGVPV